MDETGPQVVIYGVSLYLWVGNMYISMQAEASTDKTKKSLNLFPTPSHHPQLQSSAGKRQITGTSSRSPARRGKKGQPETSQASDGEPALVFPGRATWRVVPARLGACEACSTPAESMAVSRGLAVECSHEMNHSTATMVQGWPLIRTETSGEGRRDAKYKAK